MKAEINFNELDFKGAKKLAKVTKGIAKTFAVIAAIIGICALIIAFLYIKGQWQYIGSRVDPDVIENLEATYREEFKIVSKEINDTEEIYKISPKKNKNIVFTAYKNKSHTRNDYEDQSKKYFVEKVLPENLKNKLQITESYDNKVYLQETKATFLNYKILMELTDFSQIEDAAKAMKEISVLALKDGKW